MNSLKYIYILYIYLCNTFKLFILVCRNANEIVCVFKKNFSVTNVLFCYDLLGGKKHPINEIMPLSYTVHV